MKKLVLAITIAATAYSNCVAATAGASALAQLGGGAAKTDIVLPKAPAAADGEVTITPASFYDLSPEAQARILSDNSVERPISGVIGTIGTLVSIGNTLINVIRGGQIVYNNGYAAVYPKDADWRYFTWKKQSVYTFRYKKTGIGGITVLDSVIAVSFKYDGQYMGSGRYIGNIQVVGDKCTTLMGNSLNVTAELPSTSVQNLTPETPLDPLASIDLNITYMNVGTGGALKREAYQIHGDGKLIDLVTGEEPAFAGVTRFNLK